MCAPSDIVFSPKGMSSSCGRCRWNGFWLVLVTCMPLVLLVLEPSSWLTCERSSWGAIMVRVHTTIRAGPPAADRAALKAVIALLFDEPESGSERYSEGLNRSRMAGGE
jgi:hypothetical protein